MEKHTIKQLRAIAKERGLKRYSALRKAELIEAINAHSADDNHNLLDDLVPASVLTSPPQKEVKTGVLSAIKSYANRLISYVPKPIKKPIKVAGLFGKANKHEFVHKESESAIKGFTKQYTVDGRSGFDAESFLSAVRPIVVDSLKRNRGIKVNLVLTCTMKRVDIKTGVITIKDVPFVSKTEINLKATDVNKLYNNAGGKMMESMASFIRAGSG